MSVAGLTGRPVVDGGGGEVGRVRDVVVRWGPARHPPVTGLVVRVGRRPVWVPIQAVAEVAADRVVLSSLRVDLLPFEARAGEVVLGQVLDRQLVDLDGARVVRASDLYLADVAGKVRLVGVDVGLRTLLRRLGPSRWQHRATPGAVIDWATVEPFAGQPGHLRLVERRAALQRLRPSELADLLEQIDRAGREPFPGILR